MSLRPLLHDLGGFHHRDEVGVADCGEPVRDEERTTDGESEISEVAMPLVGC